MPSNMWWSALALAFLSSSCQQVVPELNKETFRASSYHEYSAFSWNEGLQLDWVVERPSTDDQSIHFCVPAAFSRAGDYAIDGAYVENGQCGHFDAVNVRLGGGLEIDASGRCSFLDTGKGSMLTDEYCDEKQQKGLDFFQQIMLVMDGQAASFKDKALFQRRALVQKSDGSLHVLESVKSCSLSQFSLDLVEFGAQHAIYLDMGSFDEGWYRYAGEPLPIGNNRTQTKLQSNWLVLKTC